MRVHSTTRALLSLPLVFVVLHVVSGFSEGPAPLLGRAHGGRRLSRQKEGAAFPAAAAAASRTEVQDDPLAASSMDSLSRPQPRRIRRVEQFARLPVWPAWNGALIWLVGRLLGVESAAKLEDAIGGRVCPNFYLYQETSPFVMLVHHCHAFHPLDPLRYFQRAAILPEGFPAHPHRGFVTITYILKGGFIHRDSTGVRQVYGAAAADKESDDDRYGGKHTQWLVTGRGMLHEEMFDIQNRNNIFQSSRQELFQIWLNVPAAHKFDEPRSVLLGGDEDTPLVLDSETGAQTLVLAGRYQDATSAAPLQSDLALFHVTLPPGATWAYDLPASFATAFLYLRKGSLMNNPGSSNDGDSSKIPVHHTAYFDAADGDCIQLTADAKDGADFMFLAGAPLREPCVASGSMVMTSSAEIEQAYRDYQAGLFGVPWDHKLSDAEWEQHVARQEQLQVKTNDTQR